MLRSLAKLFVPENPYSPSLLRYLFNARYRQMRRNESEVRRLTDDRVVGGPFKGLRYVTRAIGSMYASKLLGTYEMELWPQVEQIAANKYPLVIDIGAAEGYYAVGLATRLPAARVVAFEAQTEQHPLLRQLAALNHVQDRLELHGYCTVPELNRALAMVGPQPPHQALVVCDVEGFEEKLLDPQAVPALQHADILVELHDFAQAGLSELIRKRFTPTHRVTEILSRPRTPADWPDEVNLPSDVRLTTMYEGRPGQMNWFWMEANSNLSGGSSR